MKILTAQQMRELDRLTVERCGISYATLMETAGSRVVEAIIEKYGPVEGKHIAVFCGKGNNGGDGAVVARLLWLKGAARVTVWMFGRIEEMRGEARDNMEAVDRLNFAWSRSSSSGVIGLAQISEEAQASLDFHADLLVDALLGTGVTRPAEGLYAKAIQTLNTVRRIHRVPVVAIDIPSGLSSDSAYPDGPHVIADLTVSFTAPKIGNLLAPACEANGELVIVAIGSPEEIIQEAGSLLQSVDEGLVAHWLHKSGRTPHAHKNAVGDVLLIAGSRGKTGAAALSSETILRAGAGLVTVATSKSAQALLVTQARPEVMTEALAETYDGAISQEAVKQALQLAQKKTVIALGPGLSSSDESTRAFVRELVEQRAIAFSGPMVIDADGLNALAPWPEGLKGSDELPIILTPHPGEMARLIGKQNTEVQTDRIGIAREFATKHHVIVVLKGSRSLIAAPDGEVYVNPTGNAGMATAGSGDVLTGLIAGLLAQSPDDALDATITGVYLHGLAGDIAASKLGMRSMIASDIIANLSEAILQIGGEDEKGKPSAITEI